MSAPLAAAVKQSLLTLGRYSRVLERTTFPGVAVLCYHGIRDNNLAKRTIPLQDLHIRTSTFMSHCRLIRDTCHPISLEDLRAAREGRSELPSRPVLITFDDGYRSVFRYAAPILAALNLPATIFVCSGPLADRRMLWFDEVAARESDVAIERWKTVDYYTWRASCAQTSPVPDDDPRALMTVDELRTLARIEGLEIGGHTVWHPILARASRDTQRDEIAQNLMALAEWTDRPIRAFAYPNGRPGMDYNADTMETLRACGVDLAFTTCEQFATTAATALEVPRFLILANVGDAELAHRLAYSWKR
nr:poly-beta-1,6-N-acetyl-D-glucosamine N-deacetylase [uncultured bacterium]